MGKQMNPLGNNGNEMIMDIDASTSAYLQINNLSKVMHQNRIFSQSEINWYQTFNRYGWIDPFNTDQICKEYLFFTKPDLFIFDTKNYALADELRAKIQAEWYSIKDIPWGFEIERI